MVRELVEDLADEGGDPTAEEEDEGEEEERVAESAEGGASGQVGSGRMMVPCA